MRWLLLFLSAHLTTAIELQCDLPLCKPISSDTKWLEFSVEGSTITYSNEDWFYVECHKSKSLESPGMPHFSSEIRVSKVHLVNCFLPEGNHSLADALAALNVTLQPEDGKFQLKLYDFMSVPELAAHHFVGMEFLTNLIIKASDRHPKIALSLFTGLTNLRSLLLRGVRIRAGELQHLPYSLKSLELDGASMNTLPHTLKEALSVILLALPLLQNLTLGMSEYSSIRFTIDNGYNVATNTNLENESSNLELLDLYRWRERKLTALERCNRLRIFASDRSSVEELPARFVAACPLLTEIRFELADKLKFLPANFLEGATALNVLSIKSSKLQSLPEGLFHDTPNLRELDLSYNRLKTLPKDLLMGLPLQILALGDNELGNDILNELAPLTSLTKLIINYNNNIQDVCDESGYSPFRNMTQLKTLDMSCSHVSRICRDWREDLIYLEELNLYKTFIDAMKFFDFQYTRNESVKSAVVMVNPYNVYFNEIDYNNSLTAPETGATVYFTSSVDKTIMNMGMYVSHFYCDCNLYWLRKAIDNPNHAVKIEDLFCRKDESTRNFKDLTLEELCPERASAPTTDITV